MCGVKYLKKEGMNDQQAVLKMFVSWSSLKHNLGTDSLIAYFPAVNYRGGPFIKSKKKSYNFSSFKRLTKTTIFPDNFQLILNPFVLSLTACPTRPHEATC